ALSEGCETWHWEAARRKLAVSATATAYWSWRSVKACGESCMTASAYHLDTDNVLASISPQQYRAGVNGSIMAPAPIARRHAGTRFSQYGGVGDTQTKGETDGKRSEVPIHAHGRRWHVEPRLVAQSAEAQDTEPATAQVRSHGPGLQLRQGVQEPRPGGGKEGSHRVDDRLAGLVARGLRPLRAVVHPHGMARRRYVPHRRRPRWRRLRPAALRAAEQLARQRQPRQGAAAALAGQAEIRPKDLMGRPHRPRGQRRAGVDGVQDLWVRRRPSGRLGAGRGRLLGC